MNNIESFILQRIELVQDDITKLKVDVIVNAANNSLLGGGGVDGAIHRGAGRELLEECRLLKGCETGNAKITKGYRLPAKYVIHAVGPVWRGGLSSEPSQLASCYRKSLEIALKNGAKTIAFPNISTGVYRFPKLGAASIAISEVVRFLTENQEIEKVVFCIFDDENFEIYSDLLK
jgi:O-acetyl-ADP-ribose deacetylase (regulator of RNase III)